MAWKGRTRGGKACKSNTRATTGSRTRKEAQGGAICPVLTRSRALVPSIPSRDSHPRVEVARRLTFLRFALKMPFLFEGGREQLLVRADVVRIFNHC